MGREGSGKKTRRKKLLLIITCLLMVVLVANGWFIVSSLVGSGESETEKKAAQRAETPVLESIDVDVYSDHMIVKDLTHGKVLFEKAADERTLPASLAKMMTALVIIENTEDFDKKVKIPHDIYTDLHGSGIAVAGFEDGEELTVEDMLYGILYRSGAECCLTMAREVAGSEDAFVKRMNKKAKEIGMENTTFGNCIGLDNPPCYTTARDLMTLTEYGLKNDHFRDVFASYTYEIQPTNKCDHPRTIKNAAIRRFGSDRAGVFGGKLGNTSQAQLTLSSVAEIEGCEYLCVSTHAERTEEHYNAHVEDARAVYKKISDLLKKRL